MSNLQDEQFLFRRRRKWVIAAFIIGAIISVILLARFSYQSSASLKKGWVSFPGEVSAVSIDNQDRVWVAYHFSSDASKKINMYPPDGEPVEIPLPDELAENRGMSTLAIDPQERIWVGSWNGSVGMRNMEGEWTIYKPSSSDGPPLETGNPVWDIVFDNRGRAWIRCGYGMGIIDPLEKNTSFEYLSSDLPDHYAESITVDETGQLWAIFKKDIKTLETSGNWETIYNFDKCQGDCPDLVGSAITIDHEGQIWVGTVSGVSVLRQDGVWESQTLGDPKSVNEISSIIVDKQGQVWVGTTRQGLFRYHSDFGWTTYTSKNSGLAGTGIEDLAMDSRGRFWIGTDTGLSLFDVEAASPPQAIESAQQMQNALFPSAVLGIILTTGWAIAFTKKGALSRATLQEFSAGFFGWFIVESIYWSVINLAWSLMGAAALILWICFLIPLPITIILSIVLMSKRRWTVLGIGSAFVVNSIGLILLAPPVTDPYYSFPLFEIISMIPFFFSRLAGF